MDVAIQELRRGSQLAARLRQQLDLIPEVDRREVVAANVSEIAKAMESSVSILQSENEHSSEPGRAKAVVSPVIQSPGGTEARHVAVPRARKVRQRRVRIGEEHPM
jgi:hypothetical protein